MKFFDIERREVITRDDLLEDYKHDASLQAEYPTFNAYYCAVYKATINGQNDLILVYDMEALS